MDQQMLAKRLLDLPLGALRYFDCVGSTNTVAAQWAEAGAPDLALVVADEQTAGRGRLGRRWYTPAGAALAFSLVMRPLPMLAFAAAEECQPSSPLEVTPSHYITRLTALAALAICDALQKRGASPQIKWPNDVLLTDRKVAGVLVEMQWQGEAPQAAILGIGINVAPSSVPPEHALDYPATCLEVALHQTVDRWELLHDVLAELIRWRPLWATSEFLQAWEEKLAFRGEAVRVLPVGLPDNGQESLEGILVGLFPDGSLKIRTADGEMRAVVFGDLHLRPGTRTAQRQPCIASSSGESVSRENGYVR